MTCRTSYHHIFLGKLNQEERDWHGIWHVWETGKVHTGLWWGNLREGEHLEEPVVDGTIITKRIFKKWCGGSLDLIHLAQDMNKWRAVVNSVMNFRFS
jgi:hypothetical protein